MYSMGSSLFRSSQRGKNDNDYGKIRGGRSDRVEADDDIRIRASRLSSLIPSPHFHHKYELGMRALPLQSSPSFNSSINIKNLSSC